MSPRSSGSEFHHHSYAFSVTDANQVGEARRLAMAMAGEQDFDEVHLGRVGIIINELGSNLAKYAKRGCLLVRKLEDPGGVEILSIDHGPGLGNPADVLADGVSSRSSPGNGLGAVKRLSDIFDLHTDAEHGTVIVAQVHPRSLSRPGTYSVGAVSVPVGLESVCGDGWVVRVDGETCAMLMVDGLGHGVHAHEAAEAARETFAEHPFESTDLMLTKLHNSLKRTRGGAVFLALSKNGREIEHTGLGNIRGFLLTEHHPKNLVSQNGTAGVQMRQHPPVLQEWPAPRIAIFHTDGLHSRWDLSGFPGLQFRHPAVIAGVLFREFTRERDDATVLVIARNR